MKKLTPEEIAARETEGLLNGWVVPSQEFLAAHHGEFVQVYFFASPFKNDTDIGRVRLYNSKYYVFPKGAKTKVWRSERILIRLQPRYTNKKFEWLNEI